MADPAVVDADGLVLGRLASNVASRVLDGEEIRIINAEKAIISGKRREVIDEYKEKREKGTQRKGPFFPRAPDKILKRTVRGMLPFGKPRGREAFERLRVYISTPDELAGLDHETVEDAQRPDLVSYVTLEEVSQSLGFEVSA